MKILSSPPNERSDPVDLLSLGFVEQLTGDRLAARATYEKARRGFQQRLQTLAGESHDEAFTHGALAVAYASLSDKKRARAETEKALAAHPTSKSPYGGPILQAMAAEAYARLGDTDHAIPILKRLLELPNGFGTTAALLRLDPTWDPIRHDPRFTELAFAKR